MEANFIIRIAGRGDCFECRRGDNLLSCAAGVKSYMMQRHIPIRSGCRNGGCGVCKIRVIEGVYWTGLMSRAHISIADEANKLTLACQTFPKTDLIIEPISHQ